MAYKLSITQEEYDRLKYLHEKCGWSFRQLELRFGIPKSTLQRMITNGTNYEIIDTNDSK